MLKNLQEPSIQNQQEVWVKEYQTSQAFQKATTDKPSKELAQFLKLIGFQNSSNRNCLDLGCGRGRNSIYLAKKGFKVFGFDFAFNAIQNANHLAIKSNVSERVTFNMQRMESPWPFNDNFFDLAIDTFSSINLETPEKRKIYKNELLRVLKPNGYAIIATVSEKDYFEKNKTSPGKEFNSSVWPNGKFQKYYSAGEIEEFYSDFKLIKLQEIKKLTRKFDLEYTATNLWLLIQKPSN